MAKKKSEKAGVKGGKKPFRIIIALIITVLAVLWQDGAIRHKILYNVYTAYDRITAKYVSYDNLILGVPGKADDVIEREGYALGYSDAFEQPLWVSYCLTAEEASTLKIKRTDDFREDHRIRNRSALPEDYQGSGMDRGHLAPAADMRTSSSTMSESFYMSNMTPQRPEFNRGVWKDLEEAVRNAAKANGKVFVVTGPVFIDGKARHTIGLGTGNPVAVPDACYKVLYTPNGGGKMIGFIIPNGNVKKPFSSFACKVSKVEKATKLVFFDGLPEEEKKLLKDSFSVDDWSFFDGGGSSESSGGELD